MIMKKILLAIFLLSIFQHLKAQDDFLFDSTEIKIDSVGLILKTVEKNQIDLVNGLKEIEKLDSLNLLSNGDYYRISHLIISNEIAEGYEFVLTRSFKYTWREQPSMSQVIANDDFSVLYSVLKYMDQNVSKPFWDYIYSSKVLSEHLSAKEIGIVQSIFLGSNIYYLQLKLDSIRENNLKMIFKE